MFSLYSSLVLIFVCNATFIFSGIPNFQSDGLPEPMLLVSGREFIFRLQVYSWVYALGQSNWTCMCVDFKGLPLLWIFYPGQFLKISLQTMLQIEFIFRILNLFGFDFFFSYVDYVHTQANQMDCIFCNRYRYSRYRLLFSVL